ncbi:MAG: alpha/beta fold hydrolase, partial [Bacteroidota bacterium]
RSALTLNSQYSYLQLLGSAFLRRAGLAAPESRQIQMRVNNVDPTGLLTLIIHGTFANSADVTWWRTKGQFAHNLEGVVHDVWKIATGGNRRFPEFSWSGKNMHKDRVEGGKALAAYIKRVKKAYPNEKISIVAHSHGGNVTWEALRLLEPNQVDNVVLIATPQVRIEYDSIYSRPWYRWLYASRSSVKKIRGTIINMYSEEDSVQSYWADLQDGISSSDIPDNNYFDEIETLRHYSGAGSEHIVNQGIETSVGGQDAHGVLHSGAMGGYVGYRLLGLSHADAVRKAGLPQPIVDDTNMGDIQ